MTLLSVQAARRRITRRLLPVNPETVSAASALGRVLAKNIQSVDLPRFDNSSVDGYAVIAADLRRARPSSPRQLQVMADIPAGSYSRVRIGNGQAARIMTGAPLPPGADAVIMLEDTDTNTRRPGTRAPAVVSALRQLDSGSNVRRRGSDVQRGKMLLKLGHRLRPQDLGLLAMLGITTVRVYRKPRVALLSTGNELVAPGRRLQPGGIRDTNTVTLASLLHENGCEVISLGMARDSMPSIKAHLRRATTSRADLIVSSAGVSVGALDLVRAVIQDEGELHFWRVNVRPGKPLAVGTYRGIPFLGLPGNPVSAFMGFELFVRPAVNRLAGLAAAPIRRFRVVLAEAIKSDGRESYLRAVVTERGGTHIAKLTGHQGSGNLLSLVQANALLMIPAGVKSLAVGDQAEAWWL